MSLVRSLPLKGIKRKTKRKGEEQWTGAKERSEDAEMEEENLFALPEALAEEENSSLPAIFRPCSSNPLPGELIFEDKPLTLNVRYLLVQTGGHLWIGSPDCPYRSDLIITLWGQKAISPISLPNANKVLGGFPGSQIDIHGDPMSPAWTTLAVNVRR